MEQELMLAKNQKGKNKCPMFFLISSIQNNMTMKWKLPKIGQFLFQDNTNGNDRGDKWRVTARSGGLQQIQGQQRPWCKVEVILYCKCWCKHDTNYNT